MEQLSVQTVLGLLGIVILIGLAGELFFKKTGVPSVLFLIGLGVLLGPGLGLLKSRHAIEMVPYFGTLALLIILFDGGLNLSIMKVLKEGPMAMMFTLAVFVCTVVGTAAFYVGVLHGQWLQGLLLGAILGGTAGTIVIPIVSQLTRMSEHTRVLLSLEAAFTEVFVVVAALSIMNMLGNTGGHVNMVSSIFNAFLDALVLAVVMGVLWARVLAWLEGQALSYMLTLAAILLLYAFAELVGANGAITILLFGIVLGNMETFVDRLAKPVRRFIGYELKQAEFALDTFLKRLNEELSFLARTFFYVLLGLSFDFEAMTWTVAGTAVGLFVLALAIRWMITEGFGRLWYGWTTTERLSIAAMLPRGLATAVMAFLPASTGVPNTGLFPVYALMVIALSVVYMTAALTIESHRTPEVSKEGSILQPNEQR